MIARQSGHIKCYRIGNHQPILVESFSIDANVELQDAFISPQANRVAVVIENELKIINRTTPNSPETKIVLKARPASVKFVDDKLIIGTRDGFLTRYDLPSLDLIWQAKAHVSQLNMISVLSDNSAVASVGREGQVMVWDIVNGDLRFQIYCEQHQILAVDTSADSTALATGGVDGFVRIFDSGVKKRASR